MSVTGVDRAATITARPRLSDAFGRQIFDQGAKLFFEAGTAPDRRGIERLAHLAATRCEDGPLGAAKFETVRMPIEAAKFHQAARFAFQICDQGFIFELVNLQRQNAPPMGHELKIEAAIGADLGEIETPFLALAEIRGEAGGAGILGIAATMYDASMGEEQCD